MQTASAVPFDLGLSPINERQNSSFELFVTGRLITNAQIQSELVAAGCDLMELKEVRYGYFRKVTARFTDTDRKERIAKLAFHPYSVSLLEREAEGITSVDLNSYSRINIPYYRLTRPNIDCAVAVMDVLSGPSLTPLSIHKVPESPFEYCGEIETPASYIEELHQTLPDHGHGKLIRRKLERLREKIGRNQVPVSASHGDFVYWNVLKGPDGIPAILDFENFRTGTIAGYDEFYWFLLPFTRFVLRHDLGRIEVSLLPKIAEYIWQTFLKRVPLAHVAQLKDLNFHSGDALALMLATHAGQMLEEHQLPDITELIGSDALSLRHRICTQYLDMLERLST